MDVEKIRKIWNVAKQVIEIILAALGGLLAGTAANAMGLGQHFAQLL